MQGQLRACGTRLLSERARRPAQAEPAFSPGKAPYAGSFSWTSRLYLCRAGAWGVIRGSEAAGGA